MSVNIYPFSWHNIADDSTLHSNGREDLKSLTNKTALRTDEDDGFVTVFGNFAALNVTTF
jgi:hypothetical protein